MFNCSVENIDVLSADGQTFLIKEADAISKELGMTREEVNEIFFSQFVA